MSNIVCHAYDLQILDNYRNRRIMEIHIWSLNKESEPLLLRINNFCLSCYLELPQILNGKKRTWDITSANDVITYLKIALADHAPVTNKFVHKTKIHYHRQKQYPMLYLEFETHEALKHFENLLAKPKTIENIGFGIKFNIWESSIDSIRKLMTIQNCRYSQWFTVNGEEIEYNNEDRASIFGNENRPIKEYIINWKSIVPIPTNECKSWVTNPRIVSWDIETYSTNHRAFPDKLHPKDVAYLISCVYQISKIKDSRKRYVIIMGECDNIEICERIIKVNTEIELIDAFSALILELDPEILTGYNIQEYDVPFLDAKLGSKLKTWKQMGRLQNVLPTIKTINWSSSAYGNNDISIIDMQGRISIDMLPVIKRDYKLDKYDLNTVSMKFLKKGKHDIKAIDMFKIYENLMINKSCKKAIEDMTRVTAYCIQDSELVIDLFDKLNIWIGLIEMSNIVGVAIMDLSTRGQQIRCISQIYNLSTSLNTIIDKRIAEKYFFQGAFVFEPKPGLYENIICLDFASLYPSIMEAYNICYSTMIPPEDFDKIDDSMCNVIEFTQEEPVSGKVKTESENESDGESDSDGEKVKTKAKKEEMVTKSYKFKFIREEIKKGILPQLVHNLVGERNQVKKQIKKIKSEELNIVKELLLYLKTETDNLELIAEIETTDDNDKINLFGKIYDYCMQKKDITHLKLKLDILAIETTILDKRQNALKVSANSMYGFLGVQNGGKLPLIEGAMCITALGRRLITDVNDYAVNKYGAVIVYNDTDSSMIDLHIKDRKDCTYWGNKLAIEISGSPESIDENGNVIPAVKGLFPPPLRMEFEKAMRFFTIKKKKYLAFLINKDGSFEKDSNGDYYILKKGVTIARRDNHKYLREVYTDISKNILLLSSIDEIYGIIVNTIIKLLKNEIAVENLAIIRELGSTYKNPNFFMKLFSTELAKMGNPMAPGSRIEFLVVKIEKEKTEKKVLAGYKMREIDMFKISQTYDGPPDPFIYPKEPLDYLHYIEKTLMKPIDQLFQIAFLKELYKYKEFGYKPTSRCKFVSIETPIKMIFAFLTSSLKEMKNIDMLDTEKFQILADKLASFPQNFIDYRNTLV